MKKNPQVGERIKSLRGVMSQAEFADLLDVKQATVSAWEVEENPPSAEACFGLANLATDPDDSLFFLELAGLKPQTVLSVAERIQEERSAPAKEGEVNRIPLSRMAARGIEETGARIIQPAERLPNPRLTIGITLDEGSSKFTFAAGDVVFIDSSRTQPLDLPSFFNEIVAMTFKTKGAYKDTPENPWPRKLFIGRMQRPQQAGVYGRLLRLETLDEALHREVSSISEWNEYPDELRAPGYRPAPYQDVNLNDGWEMIGRVVAWSKKLSPKTDEKPQAPERAIPDAAEGPKKTVKICTGLKVGGEGKDRRSVPEYVNVSKESDLRPELISKDFKGPVISRQDGMKVYVTVDGKKLRFHPKTGALVGYSGEHLREKSK